MGVEVMSGPKEWPKAEEVILPPHVRVQLGRPRKARQIEPDEAVVAYKLSCCGDVVNCENCGTDGHNAKGCPHPENPNKKNMEEKDEEYPRSCPFDCKCATLPLNTIYFN